MPVPATRLFLWLLAVIWAAATGAAAADPASLAVVNARIFTGNPDQPWATALAVRNGRFVAVSTDAAQTGVRAVCGASTRVIDAHGALVTPGFIDSHIHLMVYDVSSRVPPLFLKFVRGKQSVAEKIAARAATLPEGSWILGEEWTDETWGGPLPDKAWLDALAPRHPVWLTGREGNAGIANSSALRAAGIDARTPAVPPGSILRNRRGEPTGVILGGAMWRVDASLIASTREQDERVLRQTFEELLRTGVTSVHHNNDWRDFLVLRRMHHEGKLPLRVYASPSLPAWQRMRDYIEEFGHGDEWMHWGALKGYGAIDKANYRRWVTAASAAGLRIMVHVGSAPELRTLLGIFEQVKQQQRSRFRIASPPSMRRYSFVGNPSSALAAALPSISFSLATNAVASTGNPGPIAVRGQAAPVFFVGDKLVSIVAVAIAAWDAQIAGPEVLHDLGQHVYFERSSQNAQNRNVRILVPGDHRLPLLGHHRQVHDWDSCG
jgi:hypothetical protein